MFSLSVNLPVGRSPSLLLAKVKICGAEVWSSEVEVKLIEGHGGEVHSLTCGDDSPSLWPYLEMWLLARLRNSLPGVSRGSIRSAQSQHNYSTLKEMYKEAKAQLAFSTPAAKMLWLSVLCCKKGLGVAVSVFLASHCQCLSRRLTTELLNYSAAVWSQTFPFKDLTLVWPAECPIVM